MEAENSSSPRPDTGRASSAERRPRFDKRRLAIGAGLAVLFTATSATIAFPQVGRLSSYLPGDYGDGVLYQWILRWDLHAARSLSLTHLFNANIFWPAHNTLAYSDPLLIAAAAFWPLSKVFGGTLAFNLIYLSTWIASMWGTYLLAMWFTRNRGGSILAAIVFTFAAPRLAHHLHFQLTFAFVFPFAFYFLFRFLENRRWRDALGLGLVVGATAITAGYYAAVIALAVPLAALVWWVGSKQSRVAGSLPGWCWQAP